MARTPPTPELNRAIMEICIDRDIPLGGNELARIMNEYYEANWIMVEKKVVDENGRTTIVEDFETISQAMAYKWIHGDSGRGSGPSLGRIPEIEDALGILRGEILERAGFYQRRISEVDVIRGSARIPYKYKQPIVDQILLAIEEDREARFKSSDESSSDGISSADAS